MQTTGERIKRLHTCMTSIHYPRSKSAMWNDRVHIIFSINTQIKTQASGHCTPGSSSYRWLNYALMAMVPLGRSIESPAFISAKLPMVFLSYACYKAICPHKPWGVFCASVFSLQAVFCSVCGHITHFISPSENKAWFSLSPNSFPWYPDIRISLLNTVCG